MKILIADDDRGLRETLYTFFRETGHEPVAVRTGAEAIEEFGRFEYDLVFLDIYMPGIDGLEVLRQIKERSPATEVIMITAYGSSPTAVQSLDLGAYAYLNKPVEMPELQNLVERVRELIDLRHAYRLLAQERLRPFQIGNLIAVSPAMQAVKQQVTQLVENLDSVLIYGEAGTGKRFVARILHFNGPVKEALTLQMNVADIEEWLKKRRYIHPNGVAMRTDELPYDLYRQGYGTLILNLVNELDLETQRSLAKLLEAHAEHLKPKRDLPGFRIIGLAETLGGQEGLATVLEPTLAKWFAHSLFMPPLRERAACILPVVQLFFHRYVREMGGRDFYISQPVQQFLRMYGWPGNLREVEYLVNRLSVICTSRLVLANDLQRVHRELEENAQIQERSLEDLLTQAEKQLLKRTFAAKGDEASNEPESPAK